jgi:ADP-ribosyl-[dinitrogen reductase] hydrolase
VSAAVLAETIGQLTEGADLAVAIDAALRSAGTRYPDAHQETTDLVRQAMALAEQGPPSPAEVESLGQGWIAEEALAISILCALTASDWTDTLGRAVTHSGDSDSSGAITGNLLGAWWGDRELPADLLGDLEGRTAIERLAVDLLRVRQA